MNRRPRPVRVAGLKRDRWIARRANLRRLARRAAGRAGRRALTIATNPWIIALIGGVFATWLYETFFA